MNFQENFILPDAIPSFIASGQESARRHTQHMSGAENLAGEFRLYHTIFCTASRHNFTHDATDPQLRNAKTEALTPQERRGNFETMVNACAAMCYIATRLRKFPDQEPILKIMREERPPTHKFYVDGTPQPPLVAETFYLRRTNGEIHPRLLAWLGKILAESDKPEEQASDTFGRVVEALKNMFESGAPAISAAANDATQNVAPTCTRPVSPSETRAAAAPIR